MNEHNGKTILSFWKTSDKKKNPTSKVYCSQKKETKRGVEVKQHPELEYRPLWGMIENKNYFERLNDCEDWERKKIRHLEYTKGTSMQERNEMKGVTILLHHFLRNYEDQVEREVLIQQKGYLAKEETSTNERQQKMRKTA